MYIMFLFYTVFKLKVISRPGVPEKKAERSRVAEWLLCSAL